jgi:hypothetical protein
MFGAGRSPTLVPVMMNLWSSDEGACGTVIFWKQVGHSIFVPACDESHRMCWPHTGQAYLNSLIEVRRTFHICARSAMGFFEVFQPGGTTEMPLRLRVFALKQASV